MFSSHRSFIGLTLLPIVPPAAEAATDITDKPVEGGFANPGCGTPLKPMPSCAPLEVLKRKKAFVKSGLGSGMGVALIDYRTRKRYGGVRI